MVVIIDLDLSTHRYKGHVISKIENLSDDTITVFSPPKERYETRLRSRVMVSFYLSWGNTHSFGIYHRSGSSLVCPFFCLFVCFCRLIRPFHPHDGRRPFVSNKSVGATLSFLIEVSGSNRSFLSIVWGIPKINTGLIGTKVNTGSHPF